jgi:hypothetical protein
MFLVLSSEIKGIPSHILLKEPLIVSNYPETIRNPGLIYSDKISEASVRVLYHHKNGSQEPFYIVASLQNHSDKQATVIVHQGQGGSSEDVVFAGHIAAKYFLAQLNSTGQIYTIPAHASIQIMQHLIKPNQTSSGLFRIQKYKEANLTLKLAVVEGRYPQLSSFFDVPNALMQFRPAYLDNAYRKQVLHFDTADKISSIEIGGKPYLQSKQSAYSLKGNYGVLHDVQITLKSSLASKQRVQFFVMPKKYHSVDRAVFIINGELHEIGLLSFKGKDLSLQEFYSVTLVKGEEKTINLLTLPQSGCYYPIDIVVKARDEQL